MSLHDRRPSLRTCCLPLTLGATVLFAGCTSSPHVGEQDVTPRDGGGTDVAHADATTGMDVPVGMDVPIGMDVPVGMDVPPGTDATPTTDASAPGAHVAITNYGVDLQRTIGNRAETALTVAALRGTSFGPDTAFHPTLDGDVYTQPLYLPQLTVGGATHDVLFVSTQANTVFALDAATGAALWHTGLGTPVQRTNQPCGNITPQTGILGGAVIDPATNTLYAVAYTRRAGANVFTINALDVTTGTQRSGYPQDINPPAFNGSSFTAAPHGERGAITFVNGKIYVPFGGLYGDCGTYHGWVVGIDPANPTQQISFATPGVESGIWAPSGISSDGTSLYAATGNGRDSTSMGEYVVKLATGATGPTLMTGNTNFFRPSDWNSLDLGDVDIGSNAPVVLPDLSGSSTPHLIFQGGKRGIAYLINRDNLGGTSTGNGTTGEGVYSAQISSGGVYGATAAWSDGTNVYVFVPVHGAPSSPPHCAGGTGVVALQLGVTGTQSNFTSAYCTTSANHAEGSPAVSSNGNNDGVLWVAYAGTGGLRAYSIADGSMLYSDTSVTGIRKWVPPVIADGRVYVTQTNSVAMYRLH